MFILDNVIFIVVFALMMGLTDGDTEPSVIASIAITLVLICIIGLFIAA